MKNFHLNLLVVLMIGFFLNSCSIEKRRYTSGFHTEWHHRSTRKIVAKDESQQNLSKPDSLLLTESVKSEIPNSEEAETSYSTSDTEHIQIFKAKEKDNRVESVASIGNDINLSIPRIRLTKQPDIVTSVEEDDSYSTGAKKKKKKKWPLGKIAGTLSILAWASLIAAFLLLFLSDNVPALAISLLLAMLLGTLGFVLGLIGVKKARRGKGRTGAIIGIILGSIFALQFIVFIILVIANL